METNDPQLDFDNREVVLRADFESLDEDRYVCASIRFLLEGPRAPRAGEWVYLMDKAGGGCLGQIDSIIGWTARIRPDWKTWTGPNQPPLQ